MGDVIYDDNDVRIKKDFKNVFEHFPKILEIGYSDKELGSEKKFVSHFEKMHDHFLLGSTLVKHHAFHEENEIRIVVSPMTRDSFSSYNPDDPKLQKEIRYRQIGNYEAHCCPIVAAGSPEPGPGRGDRHGIPEPERRQPDVAGRQRYTVGLGLAPSGERVGLVHGLCHGQAAPLANHRLGVQQGLHPVDVARAQGRHVE